MEHDAILSRKFSTEVNMDLSFTNGTVKLEWINKGVNMSWKKNEEILAIEEEIIKDKHDIIWGSMNEDVKYNVKQN